MTTRRDDRRGPDTGDGERMKVHVDVWLRSVHQCKTRSLATSECKAGHVRVNDETARPSTPVRVGNEVRYRYEGLDRIFKVTDVISKHTSAPPAQVCYEDLMPECPRVRIPVTRREPGTGRPTKKERCELDRLFGRDSSFGRLG